jgi:hypothetical protein
MPRPIFDIEQYELRGIKPEVFTDAQKKALNETLARVNGQIDWTAQLLGHSGVNYWGRPDRKADGTYVWNGLVETMHEKRQMQVGTYGVFNKNLEYSEWPAPLNRERIGASGDASFHIFEVDGLTKVSPLGQGEDTDYMHHPAVFAGGSYIFDGNVEIVGKELDTDFYTSTYKFIENERTWTRLTIRNEAVGGTVQVRLVDSEAEFCPLEVIHWHDISDWTSESTQNQYIGLWGNKGAAVSFDFSFDALDLHGVDERVSLVYADNRYIVRPEELLDKVGQISTFWTNFSGEQFAFRLDGCQTPFPVLSPYINAPYAGYPWEPTYIEDGFKFMECDENCDYTVIGRQYLTEVDDYDNGDYESFCSPDTIFNNYFYDSDFPPVEATRKDGKYDMAQPANKNIDEEDYDHFPRPTEGFTDCVEQIIPLKLLLDNGTLEDEIPTSGLKDEGEYDRTPWRTIDRFEFEYIPKSDCAYIDFPCLEFIFDTALDNGEMEDTALLATLQCHIYDAGSFNDPPRYECELDNGTTEEPLPWVGDSSDSGEYDRRLINCTRCPEDPEDLSQELINVINSGGPSAGVVEGEYDKTGEFDWNEGSLEVGCVDDQWTGYDDGEYDENVEPDCDEEDPSIYNNGFYRAFYGPLPYDECNVDNLPYGANYIGPRRDVYQGPESVDPGEIEDETPESCAYVDNDTYYPSVSQSDIPDCNDIDQGEYNAWYAEPCNRIDGYPYDLEDGPQEPDPESQNTLGECPDITYCPADIMFVSLKEEFMSALQHRLLPDLRNSFTPLRMWKDRVLTNLNHVPNAELEDHNFLVADQNCGATPEDSYRHFVRLPLEYPRNGREWNRAVAVCNNMSYFSTPQKIDGTIDEPRELLPDIYSEVYRDNVKDHEVFYEEDFLVSSISSDFDEVQPDFDDSGVMVEADGSLPFFHSIITEYDPLKSRVPHKNGEWRGTYYALGVNLYRTGHVSQDLATYSLLELAPEEYPVYDFSIIKKPNVQFPENSGLAPMRNYTVSYAYFAADYSASDDPVFDPQKSQCWRESVLDCLKDDPSGEGCIPHKVNTRTQYILHPTT